MLRQIGRYEVVEEAGRGAMGVVYRARDFTGRDVAIKVLLGDPSDATAHDLALFEREAEALGRLRHPNVVGLHEVGVEQGHPYLVLDWVEGESLEARLERGALSSGEAARICAQLAGALEHAHEQGLSWRGPWRPRPPRPEAQPNVAAGLGSSRVLPWRWSA